MTSKKKTRPTRSRVVYGYKHMPLVRKHVGGICDAFFC
jgi:hypothetical protein